MESKDKANQQKDRLGEVMAGAIQFIAFFDRDDNVVKINQTLRDILPSPVQQQIKTGMPFSALIRQIVESTMENAGISMEESELDQLADKIMAAHGTSDDAPQIWRFPCDRYFHVTDTRSDDASGVCVGTDITELMRQEAENQDQLRLIMDSLPVLISYVDPDLRFQIVNKIAESWYNLPAEQIIGRTARELFPDESYQKIQTHFNQVASTKSRLMAEEVITYPDGVTRNVELNYIPRISTDGEIVGMFALIMDVSARKEAQHELEENRKLLQAVINTVPHSIFVKDLEGRFLVVNNAFAEFHRKDPAELIGRNTVDMSIYSKTVSDALLAMEWKVWGEGRPSEEERFAFKDGGGQDVVHHIFKLPLLDGENRVTGLVGISEDITARTQTEEALRASEEKYRALVESGLQGLVIYHELTPLYANQTFLRMFGYKNMAEIQKQGDLSSLFSKEDLFVLKNPGMIEVNAKSDSGRLIALKAKRKDGEILHIQGYFKSVIWDGEKAMLAAFVDFSEQVRLEEQLRQSQKMEAVGQLAGGVAHDFNNILQMILGYSQLVKQDEGITNESAESLDRVIQAAESASNLTRQLLTFSRHEVIHKLELDLNNLISHQLKMLSRVLGENIDLRTVYSAENPFVSADPGMLDQVVMNLCINARDAMPNGGVLEIKTEVMEVDEMFCRVNTWANPGKYVSVIVTDTGTGMSPAVKEHIFEPFFTTKESGRGTGLGLSTTYGIVKQHVGAIHVYSEEDRGSIFRIILPMAPKTEQRKAKPAEEEISGGTETILIAEDESGVRKLLILMLESQGYTVLAAEDGEHALELWKEHKEHIDLVLLDMVMPRLNGMEVYQEIWRDAPMQKTLFSSGYSADVVKKTFLDERDLRLINKPYFPTVLFKAVREELDRPLD